MAEPLLCVQLIVRNEETLLPFCLDSVKAIADEIIVVDTGSTDRSVEIAYSYGAKVIEAAWQDDFSKARNEGLAHTQARWIFCIDADEVLSEGSEILRERLATTEAEALWVTIDNVLGRNPEERLQHRMVRLFRNKPFYLFRQRVHEQIIPSILEHSTPERIELIDLKLTHLGYFSEIKNQSEKSERNERILLSMLAESPQDPFILYNLGIAKEQRCDLHEALKDLLAAKKLAPAAAAYRPGLIRDISKLLLTLDRPDEVVRMLNEECEYYPDYPDLHYLLGRSYRLQGLFPEAAQRFQKAIGCQSPSALYPVETGTSSFRAFTELGEVLGKLGQWEPARVCFEQALESHAGFKPAVFGWATAMYTLNVPTDVIADHLLQLLAKLPDRAEKYAEVLYYLGCYDKLAAPRDELPFPCDPYITALAHLHLKQYDQAISILQNLSNSDLSVRQANIAQMIAIATWSQGSTLSYEFYWELDAEASRLYKALERSLWSRPTKTQDTSLLQLTMEVISNSIQAGLLDKAARFVHLNHSLRLHTAKCLYRNGYVKLAADLFLLLLEKGQLDGEAAVSLAEILYDRGHYSEAAAMFEQAIPEIGDDARIGAGLSYLQTSQSVLKSALELRPNSPLLLGDSQKTAASIDLLNKIDWRTEWTPAQRRNADVTTPDFIMHDCEG